MNDQPWIKGEQRHLLNKENATNTARTVGYAAFWAEELAPGGRLNEPGTGYAG